MTEEQIVEMAKTILQPSILLSFVGMIVSLLTSYVPGFREWYAAKSPAVKGLGQVVIVTAVVFGCGILSWTNVLPIVPPNTLGIMILVVCWFSALVANQTAYSYSAPVNSVILIKEAARKEGLVEAKQDPTTK